MLEYDNANYGGRVIDKSAMETILNETIVNSIVGFLTSLVAGLLVNFLILNQSSEAIKANNYAD